MFAALSFGEMVMMRSAFKCVKMWLAAVGVASLAACGSGGGGGGGTELPPLPPVPAAPTITTQPAAVAVNTGQAASFSVVATSTGLSYQWRRDGVNIAGASAASYSLATTSLVDNGAQFSVVVSNLGGSVTSAAAALSVTDPVIAPTIATQPANVSVPDGSVAEFQVVAAGTAPFTYRWLRNGQTIVGAVAASYSTPTVDISESGATYSVVVTNSRGTVTSSAATLTVLPAPPAIVRGPESSSVVTGTPVTFSVFASGTAPFTYQWRRAGVVIGGANQSTYTFTPTLVDHNVQISVVVTNSAGSATSDPAVLSVFAAPQAISITSDLLDVTVRDGERATFNLVIAGTGPFTVQWMRDGVDLPLARLDDVNSTKYTFALVRAALTDNGARYSVRITNAFGTVTSRQALLTVNP